MSNHAAGERAAAQQQPGSRSGGRAYARAVAERLHQFTAGAAAVPILIHQDPDPDAVASAFGVRALLDLPEEQAPIVTLGGAMRPENRRMMQLLGLRVTEASADELYRFDRLITVDTQPRGLDASRLGRLAVIDHHPQDDGYAAEVVDIRPEYAACATMVTEYLRSARHRRIGHTLATALLYGIRTDSDNLRRGVSPADVRAYAFLQTFADAELIHRIERPMYSVALMRSYGRALAAIAVDNGLATTFAGRLSESDSHILPQLADFCLSIEGVCWAVVGGIVEEEVVFTIRHLSHGNGSNGDHRGAQKGLKSGAEAPFASVEAGALAHRLAGTKGSGGGHATMARASWSKTPEDDRLFAASLEESARLLLRRVRQDLDELGKGSGGDRSAPQPQGG